MKIIITNIKEIVNVDYTEKKWVRGKDMSKISTLKNSFIEIENGVIKSFGKADNYKAKKKSTETTFIDAKGGSVFPSYCDSHTHLVFAESREQELVDRINGLSYQEISKKGGGILESAKKINLISEEDLFVKALDRCKNVIATGTGAIEIKSGYGLTLDSELKILRVIQKLKKETSLTIKATFLGAHAIPEKFKLQKEKYINIIIEEMIPKIAEENLADFIDVFCEMGYFSVNETDKILNAALNYNLTPKIHVNQFNVLGGVKLGVKYNALSVDHLERMEDGDFNILKNSNTMPTMLPGCSFFLNIPFGPARKVINSGLPLALASDFNPGTSPNSNMNFIASLGCLKMDLTPEEVINATTINSAYALNLSEILGSIAVGKKANLFITKPMPSIAYLPYSFGENLIDKIILNGVIQKT